MGQGSWEHFEHEADIGLRAIAPTREELFELMGEALTAIITEPENVESVETVTVSCEAPDDALLLLRFPARRRTMPCCSSTGSTRWSSRWRRAA